MKFIFIDQSTNFVRCLGLGEELAKKGHEVKIYVFNYKEIHLMFGEKYKGIQFIYTSPIKGLKQIHRTLCLLFEKNIDVVHCMGVNGSVIGPALICRNFFKKKFQFILDYEDKQTIIAVSKKSADKLASNEKKYIKYIDKIICASDALTNEYKLIFKNTFYLPFAINYNPGFNKKVKSKSDILEFCYLGNLVEVFKDQIDFIINSAVHIKKNIEKFRINIVGEGKLKEYFQNKVKELNLSNEIIFHGFVPNDKLDAFFSNMDILIFNVSDTEINRYRCPNKIFIYCSTGLPIVSNNIGEVGKILSIYPNTIFFEPDNIESFLNASLKAKNINNPIPKDFYIKNSWENRINEYLKIIKLN